MKLIVISSPTFVPEEAATMNALFHSGLELFHLRKPSYSKKEIIDLALQIEEQFHPRLVLHSHHAIAENLQINRIHFPEAIRLYTSDHELKKWRSRNFTLSTSIHRIHDYESLSNSFSYTFYGPVFDSISKAGYHPSQPEPDLRSVKTSIEIVAIGGVHADKIKKLAAAGYDGAGIHGAIWSNPEKAVETLRACQQNASM